ncbi:MAG: polysaccharide biosynthesis tyrosine autokinase [Deltaproteobacteria bacterium]|nr:polysaccharide biosynthesis tyrosine autokinase [Deltaproteobacteria bacterium]
MMPREISFDEHQFDVGRQLSLSAFWNVMRRHLGLILILFIIGQLATVLILFLMTPIYTAISTIIIEKQTPDLLDLRNSGEQSESNSGPDTFYATQYKILQSRSLAARVIRELGLEKSQYFSKTRRRGVDAKSSAKSTPVKEAMFGVDPYVISSYLQHLTIRPQYQTRLVEIAFSSPDPVLSARAANAHVRAFVRQASERHAQSNQEEEQFLESELVQLEKRIEKSESALNDYRRQRGIPNFSLDDKDQTVGERLTELDRAWITAKADRIALQAEVKTIKDDNYDSLSAVVNSILIQKLKADESRLAGQYASLTNRYTSDNAPVAQLHAHMLEVQGHERAEIKKVVESIDSQFRAATEKEDGLRREFEDEQARLRALNDASLRDVVLAREVDTNRALYRDVLERIKVLGMARESQVSNISVLDPAEVPVLPSSPKKRLSLALSGLLMLIVGIGTTLIIESADQGLKTSEDVHQYLKLPNLATVLRFTPPPQRRLSSPKLAFLGWNHAKRKSDEQLPARRTYSVANDAYRAVRTSILLSHSEQPPKTILFTSAIAGEGKSVTVINTAIAFSQMLDRVLLIDGDLRRPCCHERLGRDGHPGLTEVLTGLEEFNTVVQPIGANGLHLLSSGLMPPNPTELLASKRMARILGTASSLYQHVLIDSPPILTVSDSVILSTLVDCVVVVAEAGTSKELVREACSRLFHVGANILGVVLNKVDERDQPRYERAST